MSPRDALLATVRGIAPDQPVTVAAGWIQAVLLSPNPTASIDLTTAEVAELLDRSRVTIAGWCAAGMLPGSWRCRNREWRIPPTALEFFQRHQAAVTMAEQSAR